MPVKQRQDSCSTAVGPQQTQQIAASAFRISFHSNWEIDNVFFNGPIVAHTQYKGGGPEQGFWHCFT